MKKPTSEPTTHDYTKRGWGHDFTFSPIKGGLEGDMMGWGSGIRVGDYLIIPNGTSTTRYQVTTIRYFSDPADMWSARVRFAPRRNIP